VKDQGPHEIPGIAISAFLRPGIKSHRLFDEPEPDPRLSVAEPLNDKSIPNAGYLSEAEKATLREVDVIVILPLAATEPDVAGTMS